MEGMFEIEVMIKDRIPDIHGREIWRAKPIALSIGMGMRIIEDDSGTCWISLADNSVWKSPDDYRTTVDKISGILRHL